MASFQKRKDKWQYTVSRVINEKPKPIRKSGFRTKEEAMAAALLVEISLGKKEPSLEINIPFAEYFKHWMEIYKKPRVNSVTFSHYQYTLKAIENYFHNRPIQTIKRMDYQMFLNDFGKNKAKETVPKVNGHIKACIKDAVYDKVIDVDFTYNAQLMWTVQAKKPLEKCLNIEDSKKLLNFIHKKIHTNGKLGYYLLLLGLTSGLRYGELVGLTRKDFDFDNNTISVNKTWGYKSNSKRGVGPTKNEQSIRVIKLDNKTMKCFKDLFQSISNNTDDLGFFNPTSKYKVISNAHANNLLKESLIQLNIEPITVHGLRHTHATILLYEGVTIQYISERLGHSDIETTLKKYTHVIKELRLQDEILTVKIFDNMR